MTIKELRKKCGGYTQKELADKLGVTSATIMNWEKGHTKPNIDTCLRMADIFNVELSDIRF